MDALSREKGDLRSPLNAALVARAFVHIRRNDRVSRGSSERFGLIPKDLNDQAKYWKKLYNSAKGAGSGSKFLKDVRFT